MNAREGIREQEDAGRCGYAGMVSRLMARSCFAFGGFMGVGTELR